MGRERVGAVEQSVGEVVTESVAAQNENGRDEARPFHDRSR